MIKCLTEFIYLSNLSIYLYSLETCNSLSIHYLFILNALRPLNGHVNVVKLQTHNFRWHFRRGKAYHYFGDAVSGDKGNFYVRQ